jgi:cytoskeleton protein RodZ
MRPQPRRQEDGQVESFGTRLKREREQRKITLDDISVSTKIGTRFLSALEEDRFDQLPGGVFNKGFVRAYARHLGLDEAQAIADFVAASGTGLPESPPEEASELAAMAVRVPQTAGSDSGIPWVIFAAVLLIVAFGFAVWGFHSREKTTHRSIVAPTAVEPNPSSVSPQRGAPNQVAESIAAKTAATSQPTPSEPAPEDRETAVPAAASAHSATNAGIFVVLIQAREDSWVAITADGKPVIQETLTAPGQKSIEAHNQVVVKTGNAGALDISFNGKHLSSQGGHNEVKTLVFEPGGLRP